MQDLFKFLLWVLYYFLLSAHSRLAIYERFVPMQIFTKNKEQLGRLRPFTPLSSKIVRLTLALMAVFATGVAVMKKEPYTGFMIILAYSGIMATYAVYSALRLRLSEQDAHWVGH